MSKHQEVWDTCLSYIREQINEQSFKTWFDPIVPSALQDKVLTLRVPSKFFYEWLEEHYIHLLRDVLYKTLGEGAKLEYTLARTKKVPTTKTPPTPPPTTTTSASSGRGLERNYGKQPVRSEQIKNPFVIPGIKKMKISSQLNPNYTFDRYIEGDCNRLARSAGLAVAKRPGQTAFNPLVIFGDVGLGKTHLAHAIGNEVQQAFNKTVLYVSSEQFTNQFIDSVKNNAVSDFVNFYQLVDVLIVDDIQFLEHKQKTQEIFFHIFNHLHQSGKQLILTSDRPPKALSGMEERLISRFKWGLSADLQMPALETRMAIIEKKMTADGIDLPYNVAEFISYNIKTNIRELEGVLVSLVAQAALNQREIDINLAREVIGHFVKSISKEITVEFIQRVVADHFEIPVEKLREKTRKRLVVMARQLSMYLAKQLTGKSLKVIGENFGGRDHSTVIYSCKAVQDMLDTDLSFKETVMNLEKRIKMSVHE